MAGYAYDLGPRQSDRIIEQSAHERASVWAETMDQAQPRAISGSISSCNAEVLSLQVNGHGLDTYTPAPGQYYQILITLGETRYLTVSDLLEVQKRVEGMVLVFSRPKSLQVMQRRRFHRYIPGQTFSAHVSWQEDPEIAGDKKPATPALGQIKDLSFYGMSLRLPDPFNDHLFIGDMVYLRFSLNVREPEFFTAATICHKEIHREPAELIIGLQFVPSEQSPQFQPRLQAALAQDAFGRTVRESGNTNEKDKGI